MCCKAKEELNIRLKTEKDDLKRELKLLKQTFGEREMELDSKMEELKKSHRSSMMEMRDVLSRQKRLGDRCKSEMEILVRLTIIV